MFNTVILSGRLTADPELKTTQNGVYVTSFMIAVDRPFQSNGEKQTDFINIVAWRKTAEFVTHYFTKGSLIGIEGSIQTRNFQDKNGNNRTAFEVVANNAQFVLPKSSAENHTNNQKEAEPNHETNATEGFTDVNISDDDLPFDC